MKMFLTHNKTMMKTILIHEVKAITWVGHD